MLISPYGPDTDPSALKQRLLEGRDQSIQPLPISKLKEKHDIQPQPVEPPRPTPIPEPDRVTLTLPAQMSDGLNFTYRPDGTLPEPPAIQEDYLGQIMQAMTDAKVGFDREKFEELQEEIDAILALEDPSESDLAKLDALQEQQQHLIKAGAERMAEHAINTEKV